MHKQCKQCGDYYFTAVKARQFCSRSCAAIHFQDPSVPKKASKNFRNVSKMIIVCDICEIPVNRLITENILWQGRSHLVCRDCIRGLEERCEQENLDISSLLPTTPVVD